MKMKRVDSSNIEKVGYDEKNSELHVKFYSGQTYSYKPVSPTMYLEFTSSESLGKYFTQHIRNNKDIKTKLIEGTSTSTT